MFPVAEGMSPETASPLRECDEVMEAVVAPPEQAKFERPQFSLRDLMIATTIFAVYFAIAKAIGIWSLVIAFVCYLAAGSVVRQTPRWRTNGAQLSLDLMAGALLPIGCIVFDPLVFHQPTSRVMGLATIGSQIAMLCSWMFIAPALGKPVFAFAGGFLLFGACLAGFIAVIMFPLTLVGLLILVGVLGFIPFSTAKIYFRHGRKALLHSAQKDKKYVVLGFLLALAIPFIARALADHVPPEWLIPPEPRPFGNFGGFPN
jgi:hypothetical protein